jgi:hypothetical protein
MAGAGKRTFVAGEVLTAARVNDFLMDQAVMRFSGSAARAASITVPTEGMVTYLDDVNRLEFYDGATWNQVFPSASVGADVSARIAASLITGSAQVLVGTGSGSLSAISGSLDGQVLTRDTTASTGVAWRTPVGAGDSAFANLSASGVRALTGSLDSGFYRVQVSPGQTLTDTQLRFVAYNGDLFGVTTSSAGFGFITIPFPVASVNVVGASFPISILAEEYVGITNTLLPAPTISAFGFTTVQSGSALFTTAPGAASIGIFNTTTGAFANIGAAASSNSNVPAGVFLSSSLNDVIDVVAVQSNPAGLWSTGGTASVIYPFAVFTGNGTYVPPPGSASADVLVVAGGGGNRLTSPTAFGGMSGAGAGGASISLNVVTSGSVSVIVGAGGDTSPSSTDGSPSSFSPGLASTGGGRGIISPGGNTNGNPGGSGSGGAGAGSLGGGTPGTGGSGVSGQGFSGGNGGRPPNNFATAGGGGGKGGVGGNGSNSSPADNTIGNGGAGGSASVMWGIRVSAGSPGAYAPAEMATIDRDAYGSGGYRNNAGTVTNPGRAGIVVVRAK